MKLERILYLRNQAPAYPWECQGWIDAFSDLGIKVYVAYPAKHEELESLLRQANPDLIFAVNFTKNDLLYEGSIPFITWWLSFRDYVQSENEIRRDFPIDSGNTFTYYPIMSAVQRHEGKEPCSWLPCATHPKYYTNGNGHSPTKDLSFLGEMSIPKGKWADELLLDNEDIQRLVEIFLQYTTFSGDYPALCMIWSEYTNRKVTSLSSLELRFISETERFVRRMRWLKKAIEGSKDLHIWGPSGHWNPRGNWSHVPEWMPYYRGMTTDASKMASIYQDTKINLHNMWINSTHQRVLDAFASGSCVIAETILPTSEPQDHPWTFTEDELPTCTFDELPDRIQFYLGHESERNKIAENGQKKVLENHTFLHRANQIVADMGSL